MIMEAEKSHDLPSSSWRLRKAEAVVWRPVRQITSSRDSFWVRRPECQEHQGREIRGPTQQTELEFKHLCLFLSSSGSSTDWMNPIHTGEVHLLWSVYQLRCFRYFFQKHLPRHLRENVQLDPWATLGLLRLAHKSNYHIAVETPFSKSPKVLYPFPIVSWLKLSVCLKNAFPFPCQQNQKRQVDFLAK